MVYVDNPDPYASSRTRQVWEYQLRQSGIDPAILESQRPIVLAEGNEYRLIGWTNIETKPGTAEYQKQAREIEKREELVGKERALMKLPSARESGISYKKAMPWEYHAAPAYKNILTKQIISAATPPNELWIPVKVSMATGKQVEPAPYEMIKGYAPLYAPLPKPKPMLQPSISAYTGEVKQPISMRLRGLYSEFKKEPLYTTTKDLKKGIETGEKIISYPVSTIYGLKKEYGTEELQRGRWEVEQPMDIRRKTIEVSKVTPYTEEEAIKLYPEAAPELSAKSEERILQKKVDSLAEKIAEKKSKEYEKKFAEAKTQEEFDVINKKLNEEIMAEAQPKIDKLQKEAEERLKKVSSKAGFYSMINLAPAIAGTSFGLGVVGGLVPAVGVGIGIFGAVSGGVSLIKNIPEISSTVLSGDIYKISAIGIGFASGIAGGYAGVKVGGYIRGQYITMPKIKTAIEQSKIRTDYVDINSVQKLKGLRIPKEEEVIIQEYINKGLTVRFYKSTLESPTQSKYLPDVQVRYIEISSRTGEVIDRISLGTYAATYKGKTFIRNMISDAVGKIEGDTVKYFSRTFVTKGDKTWKPVQYIETLEEIKITAQQRKAITTKLEGEAKVSLIKSITEPKYSQITKMIESRNVPTEQTIKFFEALPEGKPYGKGKIVYQSTVSKATLRVAKQQLPESSEYSNYLIGSKVVEKGFGESIFQRILKKPSKQTSPWEIKEPKISTTEPKLTKGYKVEPTIPEPLRMQIYKQIFIKELPPSQAFDVPIYTTTLGLAKDFSSISGFTRVTGGLIGLSILSVSARTKQELKVSESLIQPQKLMGITKEAQFEKPQLKEKFAQIEITRLQEKQVQPQQLQLREMQVQTQKIQTKQKQVSTGLQMGQVTTLFFYPEETSGFLFDFLAPQKKRKEEEQGYDSYAYIQATKPRKSYWKKLNTQPMTKRSALSQSAEYVDETISARGKVSKSSSKKNPVDTGDDYFGVNRFKFRTFQQKKGTRTALPNQFIERQTFRLDKAGETKQIKTSRNLIKGSFGF